ncbi:MAG: hypothetical protein DRP10_03260 [Candidatus Aenigmatarchaeota archaeon]|nr:MAG: hypothetical protein DRP10_03260 [Candidatus Aenigmarchaeota archaeon]
MNPKGVSRSLELFIGLIVCIFILMIAFKLLGIYAAYQYEQQAQITAKNLQTAMNAVCVSGQEMEVNVNFPQQLTGKGVSPDPISVVFEKLTGGKDVSVTNALKYMTSLESFGDPWYVIYYETFPRGEDSGWEGWSEVESMRLSSGFAHGVDMAVCLAMAPLSFAGTIIRAGKMAAKGAVKEAEEQISNRVIKTIGDQEVENSIRLSKRLSREVGEEAGEEIFMKSTGRKAISKIGKIAKENLGKVWKWIAKWIAKDNIDALLLHKRVAREVFEESEDAVKYLSKVPIYYGEGRQASKEILKDIDKIFYGKGVTNRDFKQIVEKLAKPENYDKIYKEYGKYISNDLSKSPFLSKIPEKERNILTKVAEKLENGNKITGKEFKAVRNILLDKNFKPKFSGADKIYEKFENARGISRFQSKMEYIKNKKLGDIFDDDTPFSYTRILLKAGEEGKNPGLMKSAKAYRELGLGVRGGKKGVLKRVSPKITTREGAWIGSSFVAASIALSPFDVSMLKFYPCSDHALCLKSQVNPSITVYPLEDCRETGINWIQLEKYPYEGNIKTTATTFFDRFAKFIIGGESNSRFYTASPCRGKIKIWKDKCNCNYQSIHYFDISSQDLYSINCTISNSNPDLKCDMYLNRTYMENSKKEFVNTFKVNSTDISISTDNIGEGGEEIYTIYTISFNLNKYYPFNDLYKNFSLYCNDTITNISVGSNITCDPLSLPAYVFDYSTCDGHSNLWLECVNWSREGDAILEKDTIDGKKIKVEATKWCCLQWNMSYYKYGINSDRTDSIKIINVSSCGDYTGIISGPLKMQELLNKVEAAILHYNSTGVIKGDPYKYLKELTIADVDCVKDLASKKWNQIKSFFTGSPEERYNYCPIMYTIVNLSEVTLPKKTDYGKDIDPTEKDINKLLMFNLPAYGEVDCLKVSYSADDTKGFCYTSPTGIHDVKAAGVYSLSIAVDMGLQAAMDFFSGGGAAVTGVGSFVSCMAGNAVLWWGENMVSEAKQKNYWPHSAYFGNYYTE